MRVSRIILKYIRISYGHGQPEQYHMRMEWHGAIRAELRIKWEVQKKKSSALLIIKCSLVCWVRKSCRARWGDKERWQKIPSTPQKAQMRNEKKNEIEKKRISSGDTLLWYHRCWMCGSEMLTNCCTFGRYYYCWALPHHLCLRQESHKFSSF